MSMDASCRTGMGGTDSIMFERARLDFSNPRQSSAFELKVYVTTPMGRAQKYTTCSDGVENFVRQALLAVGNP